MKEIKRLERKVAVLNFITQVLIKISPVLTTTFYLKISNPFWNKLFKADEDLQKAIDKEFPVGNVEYASRSTDVFTLGE